MHDRKRPTRPMAPANEEFRGGAPIEGPIIALCLLVLALIFGC